MEDLYGDLDDPFFSLEDANKEEDQPPVSNAELDTLKEQNTKLSSQNVALKMNISCLFKTAQSELERKESMINRLMKRIKRLEAEAKNISHSQPLSKQECKTSDIDSNREICDGPTDSKQEVLLEKISTQSTLEQPQDNDNGNAPREAENRRKRQQDQSLLELDRLTKCSEIQHFEETKSDKNHLQSNSDRHRDREDGHRYLSRSSTASRDDDKDLYRHKAGSISKRNERCLRSHSHSSRPLLTSSTTLEYKRQQNKENVRVSRNSLKHSDLEPRRRLRQISPPNAHRPSDLRERIHRSNSNREREDGHHYRSLSRESFMRRERELDKLSHHKRHRSISRSPHRSHHHRQHEHADCRHQSYHHEEVHKRRKTSHDDGRRLESIRRNTVYDALHNKRYSEHSVASTGTHSHSSTPTTDEEDTSNDQRSVSNSSKSLSNSVFDSVHNDDDICSLMSDDSLGCSKFIFDDVENFDNESVPSSPEPSRDLSTPTPGDDCYQQDDSYGTIKDGESSALKSNQPSSVFSHNEPLASKDEGGFVVTLEEETREEIQLDDEDLHKESIEQGQHSLVVDETEASLFKDEATAEEGETEEGELTDSDDEDQQRQNPDSGEITTAEHLTVIERVMPPMEAMESEEDNGHSKTVHLRLGIRTTGQSEDNRFRQSEDNRSRQRNRGHRSRSSEAKQHPGRHTSDRHSREHSSNQRHSTEHRSLGARRHKSPREHSQSGDRRTRPQEHTSNRRPHQCRHPSDRREHILPCVARQSSGWLGGVRGHRS